MTTSAMPGRTWFLNEHFDEHGKRALERWLRRGPAYDGYRMRGREILLTFRDELSSSVKLFDLAQREPVLLSVEKFRRKALVIHDEVVP